MIRYKQQKQEAQEKIKIPGGGSPGAHSRAKMDPVGEAIQDGYYQELSDRMVATYSAYSYEDLPSDKLGAEFGANYFDANSKLTFGEQLGNYLNSLGATDPQNAPNYSNLPNQEPTKKPSRTNHTTTPLYTEQNQ